MSLDADIAIVGGGPAGAFAAFLLALIPSAAIVVYLHLGNPIALWQGSAPTHGHEGEAAPSAVLGIRTAMAEWYGITRSPATPIFCKGAPVSPAMGVPPGYPRFLKGSAVRFVMNLGGGGRTYEVKGLTASGACRAP